ncbi:APC family permease [Bacillus sp. RG28]|uniref:APC family permease n=1 Tax=Gottfriedia endophytica TaxID=2820819 RepID=A0A940NLX8_9BACI|nr:APC family permease [Gottfriedia endophytica]MBP0723945.1 APC family permease [Gottfriedia endophytica]
MSVEKFGYKQELKRTLSFWDLLIYGLIFLVPIAPFGVYGYISDASKGMVPLAYIIGMVGMIFTAFSYAQMSKAFPVAGSVYAYAQHGLNRHIGFIAGWSILLDYILIPALTYAVSAVSLTAFIPALPVWFWLVFFIIFNTMINIRGIEFTARANKIILVLEFAVLITFIVAGLIALNKGVNHSSLTIKPLYDSSKFNLQLVMGAVSIAVLSFLGFDAISTLSEEVKGGRKLVGKATVCALLVVGTLFIVQTWIASDLGRGLKLDNLDTAFYQIAELAGGSWLKNLTILATAFSWGIASALASQAAISRLLFSMGRDRNLPHILAKVHPKFKTPYISTIFVAIISFIVGLAFITHIDLLTNIINFGALSGFLLLHVSVINHYMIRQKSKQFIKHLVFPIIGFIVIGYVLMGMNHLALVVGITWIVVGIIYNFILVRVFKVKETSLNL